MIPFVSRWSMHSWQMLLSVQLKMVLKRDAEKILDDVWRHGWWKPSQGAYRRPQGSEPEQEDLFKGRADQRPQHFQENTTNNNKVFSWLNNKHVYLLGLVGCPNNEGPLWAWQGCVEPYQLNQKAVGWIHPGNQDQNVQKLRKSEDWTAMISMFSSRPDFSTGDRRGWKAWSWFWSVLQIVVLKKSNDRGG